MAEGAEAKQIVTKKLLEIFDGAFEYGKELRIPMTEGGEQVQIKVTLTCAKENVVCGSDNAIPGDFPTPFKAVTPERDTPVATDADERAKVAAMLRKLGM
jgi:hypothetical protein